MYRSKNTILLINEGLSDNFGDQIIKESMTYLIKRLGFEVKFEDLTRYRQTHSHNYDTEVIQKKESWISPVKAIVWKILWVVRNVKRITFASAHKYDGIVIGGGQLLLSNGIFPLALLVWVTLLRVRNKRNIVLFSVGMQGQYGTIPKMVFSYIFRHIDSIYVRDEVSKEILTSVFNRKSLLTYDSAFVYDRVYTASDTVKKYTHLLGIVDYRVYCQYAYDQPLSQIKYFESWIARLGDGVDLSKVALIYATPEDRWESLKFKHYVSKYLQSEVEILENSTHYEFLDNLGLGEVVVSGRMHSLILSLVLRKSILAYPISEKISSFMDVIENEGDIDTIQKALLSDFDKIISEILP
jgi:polysaccharide pyruvyl transferase WcaK-like protein